MRTLVAFLLMLPISFAAFSDNDRIKGIRRFHEHTIYQQSHELLLTLSLKAAESIASSTSELNAVLMLANDGLRNEIEKISLTFLEEDSEGDFSFIKWFFGNEEDIRFTESELAKCELELKRMSGRLSEQSCQIEQFREASFCQNTLNLLPIKMPEAVYTSFEQIDLSMIPEPNIRGINPMPGQSDDPNEVGIENGVMLAATAAGSTYGGTMGSVVPFFGTLIGTAVGAVVGAAVGAVIGYCGGKAAVATKVALENRDQRRLFEEAANLERAKQTLEIEEAKAWLLQNPLRESDVRVKALEFCSPEHWNSTIEGLLIEWKGLESRAAEELKLLDELLKSKRNRLNAAQVKLQEQRKLSSPMFKLANQQNELKQRISAIHEETESALRACIAEPKRSCDDKKECLTKASEHLKDALKGVLEDPSCSDEIKMFQADDWTRRVNEYVVAVTNCAS